MAQLFNQAELVIAHLLCSMASREIPLMIERYRLRVLSDRPFCLSFSISASTVARSNRCQGKVSAFDRTAVRSVSSQSGRWSCWPLSL